MRLSMLAGQLTMVGEVDDDERLRAIIDTLTDQFGLTHENIALLTSVGLEDLTSFLGSPVTLAVEKKYALAVRASYLLSATANAAPRPQF